MQQGGSELFCDPASCRTSRAAGFMGTLLLDSVFHPALSFFLIATPVRSCIPRGAAVVAGVPSHEEPVGTEGPWFPLSPASPTIPNTREKIRPATEREGFCSESAAL